MPLEATMLLIDNSSYMRNGDYQPSRFEAQSDAVNTVYQTKTDSNPENTVGIMSMAGGKGPEVLVTHTKDLGQILQALHSTSTKISGSIDIPTSIAIAQLALKHRENKNLRQRIIVFVGSPLDGGGAAADEKNMVKLAKKLKKNNVAVDVVCFGDGIEDTSSNAGTTPVLKAFIDAVSSGDNSHLITVHPNSHLISDALISSPILAGDRGAMVDEAMGGGAGADAGGASAAGGAGFEFGVDENLDPELAMALRLSMQEAQAREDAASASTTTAPPPAPGTTDTPTPATTSTSSAPQAQTAAADPTDDEESALLAQALALSEGEHGDVDMGTSTNTSEDVNMEGDDDDDDEDAAIARAIALSMQGEDAEESESKKK